MDKRYALGNVALGVLGKTGNIPFVLATPLPYADLVVGIDIARRRRERLGGSINATAIARMYFGNGEFLRYLIHDAPLEGETIPENVLQALFPVSDFAGKRSHTWLSKASNREIWKETFPTGSEPTLGRPYARKTIQTRLGNIAAVEIERGRYRPDHRMDKVLTSTSLAILERSFVSTVGDVKRLDPLAPVTVVVGSNLQHIYLRRLLARTLGAVANVRFLTLLDLAGEISVSLPAAGSPPKPLPEGADDLLVQGILEDRQRGDPNFVFSPTAKGLSQALASSIRDLREGMIAAEAVHRGAADSAKLRAVGIVMAAFQDRTRGFVDRTRLFEIAAEAPAASVSSAVSDGPVLLYGIYDLNEVQLQTVLRIGECRDLKAFIPWEQDSPSFQFATTTVSRLRNSGFDVVELARAGADQAREEPQTTLFSASDRQSEAEEVVRRVLEDIEAGTPVSDIAILHHLDQEYDELVVGILKRAQVPFYAAAGRPVRRSALGKAALNLLRLLCDEPQRGTLLEFLGLPCVTLDWIEPGLAPRVGQWEALSKETGLVRGWSEFLNLLSLCIANLDSGDPDDRAAYRKEEAVVFKRVIEALSREASNSTSKGDWSSMANWFVELLNRTLDQIDDEETFSAIIGRIEALRILDSLGIQCDSRRFHQVAEAAIRRATISGGYFQRDGLFLGTVYASRGLRFRRVYLVECAERVFPPLVRQDPILLDAERARINKAVPNGSLSLKRGRLDEERLIFALARQSAKEHLVVSYSRRSKLLGPPRLPSSFMLAEAERLSGEFRSIEAIESSSPPWFERLPSRIGFSGKDPEDALRSLDPSDLRLHVLETSGVASLSAIAPLWPTHERMRTFRREERKKRFGPFDGIVPTERIAESAILDENLSATSLTNFATCPYRFFLGKVLGVRATAEPEETLEIAPTDKGAFVHRILEQFVKRFLESEATWSEWLQRSDAELSKIISDEGQLSVGITGLPVSWRINLEAIETDLRQYLEEESQWASDGWEPEAAELWFEDLPIDAGDRQIKVRGAIDRLDRRGDDLRVVDYKSGSVWDSEDGYREGSSLQLPLYMHAACAETGGKLTESQAEFHYVSRRGGFARLKLTGEKLTADDRFKRVLGSMVEAIGSGAFFYWPGRNAENCRVCDFSTVCAGRVDLKARDKAPGSKDLMSAWWRIQQDQRSR